MITKYVDTKVLDTLCKRTMAMTKEEGYYWDWGMGVALYGLIKIYRQTGDKAIFEYVKKFVDDNLNGDEIPYTINTVFPYCAVLFVYEETGDEFYKEPCLKVAEWLMHEATRTANGGLAHSRPNDDWLQNRATGMKNKNESGQMKSWDGQLWADTLYMAVIFLAEVGVKFGNKQYIAEAWNQVKLHADCIQDENGLCYHGYSDNLKSTRGVLWGRGNSWIAACIAELCAIIGEPDCEVLKIYQKLINALVKVQDENGLWHTVLDEPTSYCETSASAGIVYGMMKGIRLGLLPENYIIAAKRGYEAVVKMVAADGMVTGVSQGTGIRETKESYMGVPTVKIMTWGQGLTVLMMSEVDRVI